MSQFSNFGLGPDARRAHLALVQGGGPTTNATSKVDGGSSAASAPALRAVASSERAQDVRRVGAPAAPSSTSFARAAGGEAPRSRNEEGIRAVARAYDNFSDALLPMVLASGVSGESASAVATAIRSNPALTAQAQRAFDRARAEVS